jgi:hypothetical protein
MSEEKTDQLIDIWERSGIIYPWWQDDTQEDKRWKFLEWIEED